MTRTRLTAPQTLPRKPKIRRRQIMNRLPKITKLFRKARLSGGSKLRKRPMILYGIIRFGFPELHTGFDHYA